MAERVGRGYRRLFELRVLHHYWLDQGETVFDSLPKNDEERVLLPGEQMELPTQERQLQSYDVRSFLSITPTTATLKILAGVGGIYKSTTLGSVVAVPGNVKFPLDAVLEFVVAIIDPAFFNYTALTARPLKMHEFFVKLPPTSEGQLPAIKVYRYKENVPVLSNTIGVTRVLAGKKRLFLSNEFSGRQPTDLIEFLVRSDNELLQLVSDDPATQPKSLSADASNFPIFVHQDDVPPIDAPGEVDGVPARGIQLTSDIPDNVFALIRLSPLRNDNDDFSFVNKDNGNAKATHPIFEVRFKNRSTFWQYLRQENGQLVEETESLPLTYFGNAGIKRKPSVDFVEPQNEQDDSKRITKLVSKIFI